MCSVQVGNNLTVDGIDFYITDTFGEGMFESCKDVKFGTMNTRAIEFIGAGAKNFRGNPFLPVLSPTKNHASLYLRSCNCIKLF